MERIVSAFEGVTDQVPLAVLGGGGGDHRVRVERFWSQCHTNTPSVQH